MYVLCKTEKRAETTDTLLFYVSDTRAPLEEIILSLYNELEEKELTWLEREPNDDIQYNSLRQWCRERMKCYQIIEVPYLSDV